MMGEGCLSFVWMLLCVAAVLFLAYWFTKRVGMSGRTWGAPGSHMLVWDKMSLGQDKAVVVAQVGERWLVLGVTGSQIQLLTELSAEQAQLWQQSKQQDGQNSAPGFAELLGSLRKKNDGR